MIMHSSQYRLKKQWDSIQKSLMRRNDFLPFSFGRNLRINVMGEKIKVLSKRDFHKKLTGIYDRYGLNTDISVEFVIDFHQLIEHVEHKTAILLGTKGKHNGENDQRNESSDD
jgi:hypothetical protein